MSQDITGVIRDVWCEVLELDTVTEDDDFFAIGGHSLTAMQVASRLRAQLGGVRVPTRVLFTNRTLASFAEAVAQRMKEVTAT